MVWLRSWWLSCEGHVCSFVPSCTSLLPLPCSYCFWPAQPRLRGPGCGCFLSGTSRSRQCCRSGEAIANLLEGCTLDRLVQHISLGQIYHEPPDPATLTPPAALLLHFCPPVYAAGNFLCGAGFSCGAAFCFWWRGSITSRFMAGTTSKQRRRAGEGPATRSPAAVCCNTAGAWPGCCCCRAPLAGKVGCDFG